jgi:hypothetical protein
MAPSGTTHLCGAGGGNPPGRLRRRRRRRRDSDRRGNHSRDDSGHDGADDGSVSWDFRESSRGFAGGGITGSRVAGSGVTGFLTGRGRTGDS